MRGESLDLVYRPLIAAFKDPARAERVKVTLFAKLFLTNHMHVLARVELNMVLTLTARGLTLVVRI